MASIIDFRLPENLTIANVEGLHEEFEALVDHKDCDGLMMFAEDVQRADTAGIQLLLALSNAAKERQISLSWDKPSEKLCAAVLLLGVDGALGIH